MSLGRSLIPEFDEEMATTRRLLERVPGDRLEWRPHPKSFPVGHLAQLVARMPGWITSIVQQDSIDLATGAPYSFEPPAALLSVFDTNVSEARQALEGAKDEEFSKPWALKAGEQVLFTASKAAVTRQTINHIVHHRGQLSVYLRLLDVPVPSIYGPTADERPF